MKDRFKGFNSGRMVSALLAVVTVILAGAALKLTAPVVVPFTTALLLAFVMNPMVAFLERFRLPRLFSIFIILTITLAVFFGLGIILFTSGRAILTLYPKYENRLTEIYVALSGILDLSYDNQLSFFENLWSQLGIRSRIRIMTLEISNSFIDFLSSAFMVALFVVFFLIEAVFFMGKLDLAFENRRAGQIKKICAGLVSQISRYLSIKFVISLVTGGVVAALLRVVGLDFALVWGVAQFILNFIPNIGSIAAGFGAGLFALLQFWPDPAPVILVVLIMLGVNMVIGNILEPKIMGDNLGLSPIVVLMALLAWGWLWGFAGMILAVPMMVIIKIICDNIDVLEPVSILLGSRKAVAAAAARKAAEEPPAPEPA